MDRKIIISGPGRAGTTTLMRIFTRLGFDTGYNKSNEDYCPEIKAGMEILSGGYDLKSLKNMHLPYILKAPDFCFFLDPIIKQKLWNIDYVIIPIRNIRESAKSRINNRLFWNADTLAGQISVNQVALASCIETCVLHDLNYVLLNFPRHIKDYKYSYKKLKGMFNIMDKYVFLKDFRKAWEDVNRNQ